MIGAARKEYLEKWKLSKGGLAHKEFRKNKRRERASLIDELKRVPCTDCGVSYPTVCMDFDHVLGEKKFHIGSAVMREIKWSRVEEELAKCEIVCANCHRLRTAKRAGWRGTDENI